MRRVASRTRERLRESLRQALRNEAAGQVAHEEFEQRGGSVHVTVGELRAEHRRALARRRSGAIQR